MGMKTNRKVPFVEQMQQTECGLCSVAMILRYYRSYESLSELRKHLDVGRDGLALNHLYRFLLDKGFSSRVYKTSVEGLNLIHLPAILHWDSSHFVVLEKIKKGWYYIVDPAFGRRKLNEEQMNHHFTQYVLVAEPTTDFVPQTKQEHPFRLVSHHISNNLGLFFNILLLSLFTYMITLSIPILIQHLVDSVSIERTINIDFILTFLLLAIIFSLFVFLRGKKVVDLNILLDRTMMSNVFHHLLRVPYKFFEIRSIGDILFRVNGLNSIRDLLSTQIIGGIMEAGGLIFMLAYMYYVSPLLTMIVISSVLIYTLFTLCMRGKLKESNLYELAERSKLQNIQIDTVAGMFCVKVASMEDETYDNWKQKLQDVLNRYRTHANVTNIYTTCTQVMEMIAPVGVLIFGLYLYTSNTLSLGEVIAFYSISAMFFSASSSLFQTWNNYIVVLNHLERIKDIHDAEVEKQPDDPVHIDLTGDIKLENVSFSYSSHAEEVIKDVTLHIKKGQKVAIVGSSGSGKSTLGKLLVGLYVPDGGDIYYDSINLRDLDRQKLRKQMGIVPQDIHLFNKSIYENIRMGVQNIDPLRVKRVADIAQISNDIEKMPMGYETIISDMGQNLSGGQRQRIALARALLNHPSVIVLDEATSSLDSVNEEKITNHFQEMGCTVIVIAHRLSTVIHSDMIYVMEDGRIIEEGRHAELMAFRGKYAELYQSYEGNVSIK